MALPSVCSGWCLGVPRHITGGVMGNHQRFPKTITYTMPPSSSTFFFETNVMGVPYLTPLLPGVPPGKLGSCWLIGLRFSGALCQDGYLLIFTSPPGQFPARFLQPLGLFAYIRGPPGPVSISVAGVFPLRSEGSVSSVLRNRCC